MAEHARLLALLEEKGRELELAWKKERELDAIIAKETSEWRLRYENEQKRLWSTYNELQDVKAQLSASEHELSKARALIRRGKKAQYTQQLEDELEVLKRELRDCEDKLDSIRETISW